MLGNAEVFFLNPKPVVYHSHLTALMCVAMETSRRCGSRAIGSTKSSLSEQGCFHLGIQPFFQEEWNKMVCMGRLNGGLEVCLALKLSQV